MLGLLEPAFSVQPTTNCQHMKLKSIQIREGLTFCFVFVNTYVFYYFCIIDSSSLSEFGKYQKKIDYLPIGL